MAKFFALLVADGCSEVLNLDQSLADKHDKLWDTSEQSRKSHRQNVTTRDPRRGAVVGTAIIFQMIY